MASTASKAEAPVVRVERACPVCARPAVRADNAAYPFCSRRCRMVDLGKWLDGDYRLPGDPSFDPPEQ